MISAEMKIAKSSETLDRLSELPELLILNILSLLETRDVVKTTLLSKRWIDLWTTVPCLRFREPASLQTLKFIDRVLQHWKGTKIQKFILKFTKEYDESMSGGMDSWLRFAAEKNVEELYILLPYDYNNRERSDPVYTLPQCIYSCSSITKLRLFGDHNLAISGNLQWDRLKDLIIKGDSINEDVIDKIVSSTPQLEKLEFRIVGSHDQSFITIQSTSLKTLKIFKKRRSTSLKIWAPNLESLQISGVPCHATCLLSNVSSLTNLSLRFTGDCDVTLGNTLNQILPIIKHVEALTLTFRCFKMLGVIMKGKHSFSVPFTNVKMLRLDGGCVEPYDISGLVEIFPNVEKLLIDWSSKPWFTSFLEKLSQKHGIGENYLGPEAKNLKPFLMQLRTVEVTWHSYEVASIFKVIKFVLKHATMVQSLVHKIVIKKENSVAREEGLVLAPRELLRLQRSFPSVDMIFYEK